MPEGAQEEHVVAGASVVETVETKFEDRQLINDARSRDFVECSHAACLPPLSPISTCCLSSSLLSFAPHSPFLPSHAISPTPFFEPSDSSLPAQNTPRTRFRSVPPTPCPATTLRSATPCRSPTPSDPRPSAAHARPPLPPSRRTHPGPPRAVRCDSRRRCYGDMFFDANSSGDARPRNSHWRHLMEATRSSLRDGLRGRILTPEQL